MRTKAATATGRITSVSRCARDLVARNLDRRWFEARIAPTSDLFYSSITQNCIGYKDPRDFNLTYVPPPLSQLSTRGLSPAASFHCYHGARCNYTSNLGRR